MEAEKSHDLLSASRRTRNATSVIQSKYEVLGIGDQRFNPCRSPKAWESGALMSKGRRKMSHLKQREHILS